MRSQDRTKPEPEVASKDDYARRQDIENQKLIKSANEVQRDFETNERVREIYERYTGYEYEKEESEANREFSDSFHDGYTLAKNNPSVLDSVMYGLSPDDHDKFNGYVWGKWFYENEERQQKEAELPTDKALRELSSLRESSREKELDREFDEL